jgi:tRNA(fMet)-specific endonuclease VapC
MIYLLDTCIISYFFKGHASVIEHFKSHKPEDLAISSITAFEIEFGLALDPLRAKKLTPKWNQLRRLIHLLSFDEEDAKYAGNIRADLQKKGKSIGFYDILIAATALRHQLICVTHNTKEFTRINNLHIENWAIENPVFQD